MPTKHIKDQQALNSPSLIKHALWRHVWFCCHTKKASLNWTEMNSEAENRSEREKASDRRNDEERKSSIQHTDWDSCRETAALSKLSAPCGVNKRSPLWMCVCSWTLKQAGLYKTRIRVHSPAPIAGHQMLRQQHNKYQQGFHSNSVEMVYKKWLNLKTDCLGHPGSSIGAPGTEAIYSLETFDCVVQHFQTL